MYLLLSLGMLPFAPAFPFGTLPPGILVLGRAGRHRRPAAANACMVKALERGELSVLGPVNAWKPVVAMIGGHSAAFRNPVGGRHRRTRTHRLGQLSRARRG